MNIYDYNPGYNFRIPAIDEIIIAPLAYPNGTYMTVNSLRKPVLARVKSVFSETVNVVNYFGYTYNVPLKHIEFVNSPLDSDFYVDMISNAKSIMHNNGYYESQPNEFFTHIQYQKYSHIPIFQNIAVNIVPIGSPIAPISTIGNTPSSSSNVVHSDKNGSIDLMVLDNISIVHFVVKSSVMVYYDKSIADLLIPGYGRFVIDSTHKYSDSLYVNRMIFKSKKQFIDVPYKILTYSRIPLYDYGFYKVNIVDPLEIEEYIKLGILIKKMFYQMGGNGEFMIESDDIEDNKDINDNYDIL